MTSNSSAIPGSPHPDAEAIHSVLQLINRELWIVTAADGDRRGGLVATWVSEASIDRRYPVMVAGIAPNHHTSRLIDASGGFALHLLRGDQFPLAWNFCRDSGSDRDKLAEVSHRPGKSGSPLLDDCLAWLDCRVFARVATGDRLYYWADVLQAERNSDGEPLRERQFIAAADARQKDWLAHRRQADIEVQHPRWLRWRGNLPRDQQPASQDT